MKDRATIMAKRRSRADARPAKKDEAAVPHEFSVEGVRQAVEHCGAVLLPGVSYEDLTDRLNGWSEHVVDLMQNDGRNMLAMKAATKLDKEQRRWLTAYQNKLRGLTKMLNDMHNNPVAEVAFIRAALPLERFYEGMKPQDVEAFLKAAQVAVERALIDDENLIAGTIEGHLKEPGDLALVHISEKTAQKRPQVAAAWLLFFVMDHTLQGGVSGGWDRQTEEARGPGLYLAEDWLYAVGVAMEASTIRTHYQARPWRRKSERRAS